MNKEGGYIPPGAEDFKMDSTTIKEEKMGAQPESDVEATAAIEDQMRAQMLLGDYKLLEKFLRVGFQKLLDVQPATAKIVEERASRMKVSVIDALVQETRLRLTNLNKNAPEAVSTLSKIVETMKHSLKKRAGTLEARVERDEQLAVPGGIDKMIWDMTAEQAHTK